MPRHGSESTIVNTEELYEEILEARGVNRIKHYKTPKWPPLTAKVRGQFTTTKHRWKLGDKYWKLAADYYGDSTKWWVIAWYNEKPTEAHVKSGDLLFIPTPLGKVLSYFNTGVNY